MGMFPSAALQSSSRIYSCLKYTVLALLHVNALSNPWILLQEEILAYFRNKGSATNLLYIPWRNKRKYNVSDFHPLDEGKAYPFLHYGDCGGLIKASVNFMEIIIVVENLES